MEGQKKKTNLLQGASIFLFLVLYINIRHRVQGTADWIVITIGSLFFLYALYKHIKRT